jgi:hypothetical protein
MPQEELGYVELEWTCKNCGTRNPGSRKNCANCGAAMGAQANFELPAQQEIIKDEAKVKEASVGPDIACPYCGTRNAANATVCKQCGGDLKGAQAREAGGVLGAFDATKQPDIKCQTCGTMNPASALTSKSCGAKLQRPTPKPEPQAIVAPRSFNPWLIVGIVAFLLLCAVVSYFLFFRTSDSNGTVTGVNWQRTIAIMALVPVRDATWKDQLPADANVMSCELKSRGYSDSPQPNSEKVCGTPYVLDQGNGNGKVVQDCQYLVKDEYCSYTRMQWGVVDTVAARGTDLNPVWPALALQASQREGNRAEEYRVQFDANGERYTYTPSSLNEFTRYKPGSHWKLTVNGLGDIVQTEPAQ